MHPVGIALAFLVFWSLVAVGAFLALSAGGRLRRLASRRVAGEVAHIDIATGAAAVAMAAYLWWAHPRIRQKIDADEA